MKLIGSIKNMMVKDKNGKNVSHLEIIEAILEHCKLLTSVIKEIQEFYIYMSQINHLLNLIFNQQTF